MKSRVQAKWVRISPRKLRQVVDLVRGKEVDEALNILHYTPNKGSEPVEKAIRSAVANLSNYDEKSHLDPENFVIVEAKVDGALMLKRFRAASMGRAMRIRKRTSHLTITIADTVE
jgi:large subunit ribosomal protein L22